MEIRIKKSQTADSRTCDYKNTSKETLLASSKQHIDDVQRGLLYWAGQLMAAASRHDYDKVTDIDGFYEDFSSGFKKTDWWDRHRKLNRHHINMTDGIPEDVDLVDVMDHIVDCVMAGMARAGEVYPLDLPPKLLKTAFNNTVEKMKKVVVVEK